MNYSAYFSRQARRPSGIFGRFYMSRVFDEGNADLNSLVFESLSVDKNDRLLEVGFGTGILVKEIASRLDNGVIEGVDFSQVMFSVASKRNRKFVRKNKVVLYCGDFDQKVFMDNSFDKVLSVNTIYFWENPEMTIGKIHRALKPGGKLVLGFHEKSEMEKMSVSDSFFRYYSLDDIRKLLSGNGLFNDIEIFSRKGKGKICYCAVATRQLQKQE